MLPLLITRPFVLFLAVVYMTFARGVEIAELCPPPLNAPTVG